MIQKQSEPRISQPGGLTRWSLITVLTSVVILLSAAAWFWLIRGKTPEYNVLLVTFDTTRADRLGCYGAGFARTPSIDLLASRGIRYNQCFAPTPITLPSHASILTGLYPFRHGLRDNGVGCLSENAVTLTEILKADGYKTGAVIGAFVLDSQFGLNQGFDFYEEDFSNEVQPRFHFAERNAEAVTNKAIAWLDTAEQSKFFLWTHYFDPHSDYAPPGIDRRSLEETREGLNKLYDMEITYADQQLGRLLSRIRNIERSTGRPTLVVFAADHGESLGAHGEPTHGIFVYNDTIRVPLVIADSSGQGRGTIINQPVSLVDVMPTIVQWLNLDLPYPTDGRTLPRSPFNRTSNSAERAIYFESVMPFTSYDWSPLEGALRGGHKLIVAPRSEFYDLDKDPGELANLYKSDDPRIEVLLDALEDLRDSKLDIPNLSVGEVSLDDHGLRRLMSLGYVASGTNGKSSETELPDPKDRIHLHNQLVLAQAEIEKQKFRQAFDVLRSIIVEDPQNERTFKLITTLATEQTPGIPSDEFIPLLQQMLAAHPDAECAVALGMLHEQAGDLSSALSAYNQAVEIDGKNISALNNSAWLTYKLDGDLKTAVERSQQAVILLENDPEMEKSAAVASAKHTLACILLKIGQTADAIDQLEEAIKRMPNFAVAFYHLGVARQSLGENGLATKSLERAISLAGKGEPEWLPDAKERLNELRQ